MVIDDERRSRGKGLGARALCAAMATLLTIAWLAGFSGRAYADAPTGPRRVLIIGIDGLRPDALRAADTPHIDQLWQQGAYTFDGRTGKIPKSGPGWATLLTGVGMKKHRVRDNEFQGSRLEQWPTLFEVFTSVYPGAHTAAHVGWSALAETILGNRKLGTITKGGDHAVEDDALKTLRQGDPHLLFVHFNRVDNVGHTKGFSRKGEPYRRAIEETDARVGNLIAAVDARPADEQWLVVVTTDHGGYGMIHDGPHVHNKRIFAIFHGPGVKPGKLTGPRFRLQDVAPTVLAWLQVPRPARWSLEGRVLGPVRRAPILRHRLETAALTPSAR